METDLPFVDEHRVVVSAPAETVWGALADRFAGLSRSALATYLRVISADPRGSSGSLLDLHATVPGFRVTGSTPGQRLELTGRHRFSRYRLVFDLTARGGETVMSARTYARFPGVLGAVYEGLVIRSGAHRAMTRRLLDAVRERAERPAAGTSP